MKKLVVGIKFRESGKVYYFDPNGLDLNKEDSVIVITANGEEFGKVVLDSRMISEDELEGELKPVIRKASEEDLKLNSRLKSLCDRAREVFENQVSDHELSMKLIDVTYTFDEKKVIFYFTADGRVDFRELVKDLAGYFHARIELRQIGVRDEARKFGGIGVCGRNCCCSSWLSDFVPVSIKMAKEQNLSLNSTKISGVCGRLLCCLNYEEEYYEEVSKRMPQIGAQLKTPDGMGTVYKLKPLEEAVLIKLTNERDEIEIKRFTLEELDKAAKEPEVKKEPVIVKPVVIQKEPVEERRKKPRVRKPKKVKEEVKATPKKEAKPKRKPKKKKTENKKNIPKNTAKKESKKPKKKTSTKKVAKPKNTVSKKKSVNSSRKKRTRNKKRQASRRAQS